MKSLITLSITVLALATFTASVFAGDCGSCPASGAKKDKDKTAEEGKAS
ncbi:MAG: hypothetical protein ACOYOL_11450 [Chthoniobacterales bacterium]